METEKEKNAWSQVPKEEVGTCLWKVEGEPWNDRKLDGGGGILEGYNLPFLKTHKVDT